MLARLVSPSEHGLYAMAASVTLFLWMFRDLGLGTATVQTAKVDESLRTALLWVHLGIGLTLTLVTTATGPFVAKFYALPSLTPLLGCMSLSFLFIGIGGLPRSLLVRELRFRELNQLESIAAVTGTVAMIAAALMGAGAYAFAVFLLVWEFLCAALAWWHYRWRPTARAGYREIRPLIRAGLHLTQYNALNYLSQQIEIIAIGQWLGAHKLGLYNRSGQMLALPMAHIAEPLSQVSLTTLSRVTPASTEFCRQAVSSINLIAHLTLPIAAFAIAAPEETVRSVLGPQWNEAAPILRWLAVSAAITQLTLVAQSVALAAGQSRRLIHTAIFALPFLALAVILGIPHGAIGVAMAVAAANLFLALPRLWWRLHGSPLSVSAYANAILYPFINSTALATGATLGRTLFSADNFIGKLSGALVGATLGVALAGWIFSRLRQEWSEVWTHLPWGARAVRTPSN